jgi:NADH dehydrogenase
MLRFAPANRFIADHRRTDQANDLGAAGWRRPERDTTFSSRSAAAWTPSRIMVMRKGSSRLLEPTATGLYQMTNRHRIVIVGGGFGGLAAAKRLSRQSSVDVKLIDRRNFHLFQPLLYQVATGELSPANIASPLRAILRRQKNIQVLMSEVIGFDFQDQQVLTRDESIPYDSLIVASGATHSYFGHDDWANSAPGLKSIEDATLIRQRILSAFEKAECEPDRRRHGEWLTFVIVGGGPTGVELAGALSEVAHHALKHDFRSIHPEEARILLIEAGSRPLSMYPEYLSQCATGDLARLKVELLVDTRVIDVHPDHVQLARGTEIWDVPTHTVIWAAGVAASPLAKMLAEQTHAALDRAGRVATLNDCSLPGHPNVFAIGDMASFAPNGQKPLPGLAPVAMQQGKFVADLISARMDGRSSSTIFQYRDRGSMAVIGRCSAVAMMGNRQLKGFPAWFIWVAIHLMELIQFRNRLLVMFQWAWTFVSRDRHARLITGDRR